MKRSGGFTLIEMLVALAVSSLLLVAGSTLLIQTLRAGDVVERHTGDVRALDVAHSLLRDDLAGATLRKTRAPNGLDAPQAFTGGQSLSQPLLAFTRNGWLNPAAADARGDLQRVEYFVQEGRLLRRAWLRPDPVRETPYAERVIADGIDSIGLRFFAGHSWQLNWSGQAESLPELVEMTFVYGEGDELRQVFLVGGNG
ncbi:MAG: type II secretion system minor pseudopilin GspJ [Alphaproteobacteria bacterium]|nr:type II secretion system protein GspJ [Hyphomonas sp.]MBR9807396.1 type II secretion system minor pseudopilin GspJ [Alphaproteobacteria bacterium]|tara:strand:+ start:26599 stop:27195 length:597 start_codon:yes stop_codon:yes gene_type:complete